LRREPPPNYVSARHLIRKFGISADIARNWSNQGKIRAHWDGKTWFYPGERLVVLVQQYNAEMYPILIDEQPVTLQNAKQQALHATLTEILGDYISATDANSNLQIDNVTLRKWRASGTLRARKIRNIWYYSREDLRSCISNSKT